MVKIVEDFALNKFSTTVFSTKVNRTLLTTLALPKATSALD